MKYFVDSSMHSKPQPALIAIYITTLLLAAAPSFAQTTAPAATLQNTLDENQRRFVSAAPTAAERTEFINKVRAALKREPSSTQQGAALATNQDGSAARVEVEVINAAVAELERKDDPQAQQADPAQGAAALGRFQKLIEFCRAQNISYPPDLGQKYILAERRKAVAYQAAATRADTDAARLELLLHAVEHQALYVDVLKKDPDMPAHADFIKETMTDHPAALYSLGRMQLAAAEAADASGNKARASPLYQAAFDTAQTFFRQYPQHERGQNMSTILLAAAEKVIDDDEKYLTVVKETISKLAPGHEVMNELRARGVRWSSGSTSDLAGDQVLDLVMETQKVWFPEKYRENVNYQWALLQKATNAVERKDFPAARALVSDLRGVKSKDYLLTLRVGISDALKQADLNLDEKGQFPIR